MFKKMQNRKGFTLIEMMVVIAIVAVLVAVVVPVVGKAQIKAKAAADAANLRNISATISTRYVTTTDRNELAAGLEAPTSELKESPLIVVYVNDKTMNAYYADALVGSSANYRGLPYNATVSEIGQTEGVPYDTPEGTLVCVLGSGEYAGDSLEEILMSELQASIENAYNTGKTAKESELYQDALDYFYENADAVKKEAFINAYAEKYYNDRVANLTAIQYGTKWGVKLYAYDVDGDGTISDTEKLAGWTSIADTSDIAKVAAEAAILTNATTAANNAYNNGGMTETNPDAATLAGQNAANAIDTSEEAANKYAQDQVNSTTGQLQAGIAGATTGAGALTEGLDQAAGILGDTEEGQQFKEDLEEWFAGLGN